MRQLLREGDLEENKVSRSPTLRQAKPLATNLKTPADEENGQSNFEDPTLANLSFLESVSVSHGPKPSTKSESSSSSVFRTRKTGARRGRRGRRGDRAVPDDM